MSIVSDIDNKPSMIAANALLKGAIVSFNEEQMKSHMSMKDELDSLFKQALKNLGFEGIDVPIRVAGQEHKHQYQVDASMSFGIFGKLKKLRDKAPAAAAGWKSPTDVAEGIVAAVASNTLITSCKVTGKPKPPFINIFVTAKPLAQRLQKLLTLGICRPKCARRKVAVDYSSPNVAKDMHVGHLRSSVIGDAVCRVLEFCGHEVLRFNHVGDWGTQFGMLIAYLKERYPDLLDNPPNIKDLTKLYKAAKVVFAENPEFKKRSQMEVVKLQAGDKDNMKIWKMLCKLSEQMFTRIYTRLGIHPDLKIMGESFYNDKIPGCIQELEKTGIITPCEGAKLVWVDDPKYNPNKKKKQNKGRKKKAGDAAAAEGKEKEGPPVGKMVVPLIAVKGDGGYGYDSTDLAAVQYRLQTVGCDWVIYCVDAGQQLHFQLIFGAAKMAGWMKPDTRLNHVMFGVVTGADGKRMKTRSGETVSLASLLDEGVKRCSENLVERVNAEGSTCKLSMEQVADTASKLAHGCVKYFDLRLNRNNNYGFDYDKMLNPEGDTNVYLQQQHARIASIFRLAKSRFGVDIAELKKNQPGLLKLEAPTEIALGLQVLRLPEVVSDVMVDLLPSGICLWLYQTCKRLSSFYAAEKVLNGNNCGQMKSRLLLLEAAATSMRKAMELIGIEPLYQL